LATQRPAGVIKGNLRANTNLRVALRMADESDSDDVIGTSQAATFDPAIPGRGVAKSGPGRLTAFQSAYVGGHTSGEAPPAIIDVHDLYFGVGSLWELPAVAVEPDEAPSGPNDISRIVATVAAAAETAGLPAPRKPWLPELAHTYRLEDLPTARTDTELVFGVIDDPDAQAQPVTAFVPDTDVNMAVFGTGGSGKSTFLRTLAVAAGFAPARGGPCTVYAIDFGSRGLQMLEEMPHVGAVINGDDNERIVRLLRQLKALVDERATRYAKLNASTLAEYRDRSGDGAEARVLLLIDGFGAFRSTYEVGPMAWVFEMLLSIAAAGRSAGIHVVVTADRPSSVPASLASSVQKRLVLRLANDTDYSLVGISPDAFGSASPPGRGFIDEFEVQVGVLGGDSNVARQAAAVDRLTAAMLRAGVRPVERIASLPERVAASSLGPTAEGWPPLGVWDETLGPIGFEPVGTFLVAGPPQSGKTSTVGAMVAALRRSDPATKLALFGSRRSPLGAAIEWDYRANTPDEMDTLAEELTPLVAAEDPSVRGLVVVIEQVSELLNSSADLALQGLLKACRSADHFVIAESESSTLGSSWPLLQAVKSSRTGIVLQPEQLDGDVIFKTPFPRVQRSEFPPGRGFFVRAGKIARVHVALPE
ncbi:MAG TPA: FtsK/SpoIIIE domain-containing protein, partial [Ilumatobacteraceae bacterium]|nr:FtsK/SpoIIIE domain-containing protein [Ilumatobacteraceae bacterium]